MRDTSEDAISSVTERDQQETGVSGRDCPEPTSTEEAQGLQGLRIEGLQGSFASNLPVKLHISALDSHGKEDSRASGEVQLAVSQSLIFDTFLSSDISPWKSGATGIRRNAEGPAEEHQVQVVSCSSSPLFLGPQGGCLQLSGGVGDAKVDRNWTKGCKRTLGNLTPDRFSFCVKSSTNSKESAVLFLTDANERTCAVFAMKADGRMGIENELIDHPVDITCPFEEETWYVVEFVFHWDISTFDFSINHKIIGRGVCFEDKRVKSIEQIYISNSHPDSTTCWDKFVCSLEQGGPSLDTRRILLHEGAWRGYISFDSKGKDILLRAEILKKVKVVEAPSQPIMNRTRITSENLAKEGEVALSSWVVQQMGISPTFSVHEVDVEAVNRCNVMSLTQVLHAQVFPYSHLRHLFQASILTPGTQDLQNLLNDPEMSDLCFLVEGKRIHVHKAILYARSPHFKSMYES